MPWETPSLLKVRSDNAAYTAGKLKVPVLPNGEVRVLADANAGNAHLNLQYLDWQALQYLPDTAERQFLDKWASIYLQNADGSRGRKQPTYAVGTASVTGIQGSVIPQYSQFTSGAVTFESTVEVTIGVGPTIIPLRALDAGVAGNLAAGTSLSITVAVAGVQGRSVTVVSLINGTDGEKDDELRARVLDRIRKPPMGGDADDYVAWALEYPGVTRAWCAPNEMGIGTVTVRFMMDSLRATDRDTTSGFPNATDTAGLQRYLDSKRPVAIKDFFVEPPIPEPIGFRIDDLYPDSVSDRAAIKASVRAMLATKAAPATAINGVRQAAQTIYRAWVSAAISQTAGVEYFDLAMTDHVMPHNGSLAVLGNVY